MVKQQNQSFIGLRLEATEVNWTGRPALLLIDANAGQDQAIDLLKSNRLSNVSVYLRMYVGVGHLFHIKGG